MIGRTLLGLEGFVGVQYDIDLGLRYAAIGMLFPCSRLMLPSQTDKGLSIKSEDS